MRSLAQRQSHSLMERRLQRRDQLVGPAPQDLRESLIGCGKLLLSAGEADRYRPGNAFDAICHTYHTLRLAHQFQYAEYKLGKVPSGRKGSEARRAFATAANAEPESTRRRSRCAVTFPYILCKRFKYERLNDFCLSRHCRDLVAVRQIG